MKLSKVTVEQWKKVVKAALYVSVSAGLAYLTASIADKPDLFGPLTPLINVVLVMLKQAFTPAK